MVTRKDQFLNSYQTYRTWWCTDGGSRTASTV